MKPTDHSTPRTKTNTGSPQVGGPVYLVIGKLQRTHGVKGEIVFDILTDFPDRIKKGQTVFIGSHHAAYIISGVRSNNDKLLLSFEGLGDCDQVAILRNQMVYIKTEDANSLPDNEFYHHEILGMQVFDELNHPLGTIIEIIITGANDVFVINSTAGDEILIPAIKSSVLSIDRELNKMIVRLPEWE